jgi:NTP pyrophosphatase (non-canonical NTP hydrolase)
LPSDDEQTSDLHSEVNATCFVQHARALAQQIYATAIAHGWWDEPLTDLELLAGHHAELSEAYEALRDGNPQSDKIPEFTAVEEELADTVIRILGHGAARGWDIPGAIMVKMAYNEGRAYKHGNKKF